MKKYFKEDQILFNVKKVHMIGIGGSGMCPLAEILHSKGYEITGSDNNESDPLKMVRKIADVSLGHDAENVKDAQLVIYSAAIFKDNVELVEAKKRNIPIMERSEVLGALSRMFNNVIGISGTHGKTTVTSLITQILIQADFKPNAVIGGKLPLINHYGITGDSDIFVVESCEFADTFLKLSPDIAVVLNIDNDHLEYFKTMDNMVLSYSKFVSMASKIFINGDDKLVLKAVEDTVNEIFTFGFNESNDYYPKNVINDENGFDFDVYYKGEFLASVINHIPGKHNIYNALAAFSVCHHLGVPVEKIADSIAQFSGAGRRFEKIGNFGFDLYDDYGHHPTEIEATLTSAKHLGYDRVVVVFQPFTFSRTKMLKDEFIKALSIADEIILTPIMGSREVNTYGIYSEDLQKELKNSIIIDGFEKIKDYLLENYHENDLVITMGCGDIYKVCRLISEEKNA
ncbi:MAG: UDP-N-acetylmuramate--L-alanine ligase [Erysipelotrichaceae bacterium]|jgi:UDP-N-acetylmuramate--alanine ligase